MRVYDASDFTVVADIPLAAEGESSFVNDLILSKTAAYITDSTLAQLYKVRRPTCGLASKSTNPVLCNVRVRSNVSRPARVKFIRGSLYRALHNRAGTYGYSRQNITSYIFSQGKVCKRQDVRQYFTSVAELCQGRLRAYIGPCVHRKQNFLNAP